MKYQFAGSFIVATAESIQENAVLLSTQGALRVEEPAASPQKRVGREGPRGKRAPRDEKGIAQLKNKLETIVRGGHMFLSKEEASVTRDINSYCYYFFVKKHGVKVSINKAEGGYNITVR